MGTWEGHDCDGVGGYMQELWGQNPALEIGGLEKLLETEDLYWALKGERKGLP